MLLTLPDRESVAPITLPRSPTHLWDKDSTKKKSGRPTLNPENYSKAWSRCQPLSDCGIFFFFPRKCSLKANIFGTPPSYGRRRKRHGRQSTAYCLSITGLTRSREPDIFFACGSMEKTLFFLHIVAEGDNVEEKNRKNTTLPKAKRRVDQTTA